MKIQPISALKVLLLIIFFLVLLNIGSILIKYFTEGDFYPNKLITLFYLDSEKSFGTVFSFLQLFISAILLFLIFKIPKESYRTKNLGWLGLSAIFLGLSLDEILEIHEKFNKLNLSGYLYFSWVVPYSIGLILFILVYIPFLKRLLKKYRFLFILSGIIFTTGAIGVEMIGGKYFETNGHDLTYSIYTTIEEFLEMIGISLFIYSLLDYIALKKYKIILSFQSKTN